MFSLSRHRGDIHNKPWSRVCDRWQFYSLSKHFTLFFQIDRRSKNYYMGIWSYWLWRRLKIPSGTRSPSENCLTFSWSNSKPTRWYGYEKYGLLTACKFWVGNIFITACLSDHEFKWYMLNVLQWSYFPHFKVPIFVTAADQVICKPKSTAFSVKTEPWFMPRFQKVIPLRDRRLRKIIRNSLA